MSYRYSDLEGIRSSLQAGVVSSKDLTLEALRLFDEVGQRYNALASLMTERAIKDSDRADRRLQRGNAPGLCGVPFAAKDLFAAKGAPTTWGSSTFADQTFDRDAEVIRRLTRAGAVLVAKTALSELAGGGRPKRPGASMHGSGINPWASDRYSGGSSSGSAIAVATGLVPYALGTETGGSILGPAAFSGVTGIRPTAGHVPTTGAMTLSWSLDKVGVLARSARTCADVLLAILDEPWRRRFRQDWRTSLETHQLTVGVSPSIVEECSPEIRPALEESIEEIEGLGVTLIEAELGRHPAYVDALELIIQVEGAYEFLPWLKAGKLQMSDERQLANLQSGMRVGSMDYLHATRGIIGLAVDSFNSLFSEVDIVLSASRVEGAPPLDLPRAPRDGDKQSDLLRAAGNLAGVPAVSIPCGFSTDGLPVGIQFVGPPNSEATLLRLAASYQSRTKHHEERPPNPDNERKRS